MHNGSQKTDSEERRQRHAGKNSVASLDNNLNKSLSKNVGARIKFDSCQDSILCISE